MNAQTLHEIWSLSNVQAEVSIDLPKHPPKGLAVIAHPHPLFGGTQDNKVVQTIARAMLVLGYTTVRFNFRGVGQSSGQHDHGLGEIHDLTEIVQHAYQNKIANELKHQPIALAGFSFGAYVISHSARLLEEKGLPIGKLALVGTATSRFQVAQVPQNSLIIHGEQDDTVPLQSVLDWARPQNLPVVVLPGVEHFFHGQLPLLKNIIVSYYPNSI